MAKPLSRLRRFTGHLHSASAICALPTCLAATLVLLVPGLAGASNLPPAFDTPVPAGFDQVVALASDKIDIEKDVVVVSGSLVTNDDGSELRLKDRAATAAGYSVTTDDLTVDHQVGTDSTFFCNDLSDKTGTVVCAPASFPVFATLPTFLAASPGTDDVSVPDSGSLTLDAGAYGKLDLDKRSTLTLTGGLYDFEELRSKEEAEIVVQAPVVIRVDKNFDLDKDVIFGPASGSGLTAADIRVYVADGQVRVKERSVIHAGLFAPDEKVDLEKDIQFHGAILAREISVKERTTLTLVSPFVNRPPVAVDDGILVSEGGSSSSLVGGGTSVLDNDSDPNGDALAVTTTPVSAPANGVVVLNADGTFTYTHDGSETTVDAFSYEVCDDGVAPGPLCSTATVAITVTPVNDAPVPGADSFTVDEGGTASLLDGGATSLLANDTDAEGNGLTVTATPVSGPSHGTVALNADGTFTYTHDGSETTADAFSYQVCDDGTDPPGPLCSVGSVSVTVTPVNDPPVATDDTFTVDEGGTATQLDGGALSLLANDSDVEGDGLSVSTTPVSGPANGTVTLNADGTFSYTHDGSETTSDAFTYEVCDDGSPSECATANVSITVNPVNDDPTADPQSITTQFTVTITLTGSDAENDPLTFTITGGPDLGTLGPVTPVNDTSATVDYTPPANPDADDVFDSFTFQVDDGNGGFDSALVSIDLVAPNSPPVTGPDTIRTTDGGTATSLLGGGTSLLTNDFDPEGTALTVQSTPASGPTNGTVTLNADGTFSYTHAANGTTSDAFTYTVCDAGTPQQCSNGQVSVQVLATSIDVTLTFLGDGTGTVTSSPAGVNCSTDCTATISGADRIDLAGTPGTNSAFAGFGGDADCSDGILLADGNKNCTVTFNAVTPPPSGFFNLTVSKTGTGSGTVTTSPAGIDCGATCTAAFPAFERIALLPEPAAGSEFVNWNGTADCLDGDLIRLPGEDASCVAVFDAIVVPPSVETLTVVVSGPGTVQSSPTGILCREDETCSEDFASGALVSLAARPAGGGTFLGWSGDCTGTFPLVTVTLDAAKTCTANFQP